jgi:hypothetical protein
MAAIEGGSARLHKPFNGCSTTHARLALAVIDEEALLEGA